MTFFELSTKFFWICSQNSLSIPHGVPLDNFWKFRRSSVKTFPTFLLFRAPERISLEFICGICSGFQKDFHQIYRESISKNAISNFQRQFSPNPSGNFLIIATGVYSYFSQNFCKSSNNFSTAIFMKNFNRNFLETSKKIFSEFHFEFSQNFGENTLKISTRMLSGFQLKILQNFSEKFLAEIFQNSAEFLFSKL